MQQRFKKIRTSWMEELLISLSSNPILACDFAPIFKSYKNEHFSFQVKSSVRTLSPPELSIDIDQQTVQKLNQKAIRTRKTYQANLLTDSLDNQITSIQELPPQLIDGEDEEQNDSFFFKIGLAIVKQQGVKKTKERIQRQLRHCSQRSGAKFKSLQRKSDSSDLCHLLLSLIVRMFLAVQQKQKKLKIARLLYYPKVDIQIQKIKITPFSFIMTQTLKRIQDNNHAKQTFYGYVSLSQYENKGFKFCMLSVQQFQKVSKNNFPVIGIFVAGKIGGQLKQDSLLWSLIMEYLSNPLLNNRRLCLNGPRTGFLLLFEENNKNTNYQFQVPASAKWKLSTSVQTFATFPKQIIFSTRQIIMQQDREQSQIESVQSKQIYPIQDGPPDSYSSRSFDEKDMQIARLKAELEKYKNQNEWLKQLVANLTTNQAASKPVLVAAQYPLNNAFNTNIGYQPNSQQPYFNNFTSQMQISKQKETARLEKGEKQFRIKDSKNISFAQQNSYDQQNQFGSFLQDQQLLSPQFTLNLQNNTKQQVKPFQILINQQQRPYFQQQIKPPHRQSLQNFIQNKTLKTKNSQDSKYEIQNANNLPSEPNKYTTYTAQKRENVQISKNMNQNPQFFEKETVSPSKGQNYQAPVQRSKALGSITPRQPIEISKKYLDQEPKQQSQKKGVKKIVDNRKKQQDTTRNGKKNIALDSQSEDDEELKKILTEKRNNKK